MSSTEYPLTDEERLTLRHLARDSIAHGLSHGSPVPVDISQYSAALRRSRATFVTLTIDGELRGCIGTLEARRPLVQDVVENAYASAFSDPRFPPLQVNELPNVDIHISVLSPAQAMQFGSESDLLHQLRPGVDGLILQDANCRGTFLPSVWESLPTPREFLSHLKRKAGLPADHWSQNVRVWRYTTESI